MVFVLGKLGWLLLRPSNLLLLLALIGLLGLWRRRPWAPRLLAASLAVTAACVLLPVGNWLTVPLENRFPRPPALPEQVDGVVFLGGGIDGTVTFARGVPSFGETMERFAAILELARQLPNARLVFTGGTAWRDRGTDHTEAAVIRRFLADQGLSEGRVALEARARSTRENALLTLELMQPRLGERWLLVTSAKHMPRAIGVFRRAGWPGIEAWPVDYHTTGAFWELADPLASVRLVELDEAAYEWFGLLYYRLLGYTDGILPGPEGPAS
jgi:uncharacterized SAM-binding protein YcdF (DUF218 family)